MKNRKIIFDTNTLLINPALITRFSKQIIVTKTILNELDYRKKIKEHQENAQLAINNIEKDKIKIISCQATITFSLNDNYFYRLKLLKNVS